MDRALSFGMAAMPTFAYILVVYPAYVFVMNAAIVAAKFLGTKRRPASSQLY
jgi:hypothetical protein